MPEVSRRQVMAAMGAGALFPAVPSFVFAQNGPKQVALEARLGNESDGKTATIELHTEYSGTRNDLAHRIITQLIERQYKGIPIEKNKHIDSIDAFYRGLVRDKIVQQIRAQHPSIFPFGLYLSEMTSKVADFLETAKPGNYAFTIKIPQRFFDANPVFWAHVVKNPVPTLILYQFFEGKNIKVSETLVTVGGAVGKLKVKTYEMQPGPDGSMQSVLVEKMIQKYFRTPNGIYDGIAGIQNPRWYPPPWAGKQHGKRQPIGLDTAFGENAIEMLLRSNPEYPNQSPTFRKGRGALSNYLLHGTGTWRFGQKLSHGCVRHPANIIAEHVAAMNHYLGDREFPIQKLDFGIITRYARSLVVAVTETEKIPAAYQKALPR